MFNPCLIFLRDLLFTKEKQIINVKYNVVSYYRYFAFICFESNYSVEFKFILILKNMSIIEYYYALYNV